jgi:cytidylate kinase
MNDVITIDGPAGSGKSTVSRLLAKKLNYLYLDTGAMYRAVALEAKRRGIDPNDGKKLGDLCRSLCLRFKTDEDPPKLFLDQEDISTEIRTPEIDMLSSDISAVREVRNAMVELQRKMVKSLNVVAEGRDMGTVVFKDSKHKYFLRASPEVRAERRYKERLARGETVFKSVVVKEITRRDDQDSGRSLAPLRVAEDAKIIDSSALTPEEVVGKIICSL